MCNALRSGEISYTIATHHELLSFSLLSIAAHSGNSSRTDSFCSFTIERIDLAGKFSVSYRKKQNAVTSVQGDANL